MIQQRQLILAWLTIPSPAFPRTIPRIASNLLCRTPLPLCLNFSSRHPPQQKSSSMVQQLHKQLSRMIDNIGNKVTEVIDRSESEFLIAYRNHMKRIRNQLEEMRHKLQIHQNETSVQKVSMLEKQLRLFREESLKMYDKLELKNRECEEITMRLKQMKQQNAFLQGEVKKLMKINKLLQIEKNKCGAQSNISIDQSISANENTQQNFYIKSRASNRPISHTRVYSTKGGDTQAKEMFKTKIAQNEISHLVKKIQKLQSKCKQHQQSSHDIRQQNQLESFFLECVETVRKDIYKKQNRIGPERWGVINFELFKSLDKIRVLNLFVNNENVMKLIYNEVFSKQPTAPSRYFSRLQTRTSKRSNRANSTFLN